MENSYHEGGVDGAEAAGCLALGQLFRSTLDPAVLANGTLALARACRLGNLEACAEEAEACYSQNRRAHFILAAK